MAVLVTEVYLCHSLVHRSLKMDKSSFEIRILPLYKRIYAMCLAVIGDSNEAGDAVQETFAILWERRNELDHVNSTDAYVRSVARNVCIRRLKFKSKHGRIDDVIESYDDDQHSHNAEVKSELIYLRSLIDGLPEMQRRVMTLSVFGGCSNDEIVQITGEGADNVRQLLSRARKKIKELYKKNQQS